jgi:hypothetical protein
MSGERVDLRAVEKRYKCAATPKSLVGDIIASMGDVPDLIAELRVAREELKAAQEFVWFFDRWRDTHEGWEAVLDARKALPDDDQEPGP